jgi:hypothetical protein
MNANTRRLSVAWGLYAFAVLKVILAVRIPYFDLSDARRHARTLLILAVIITTTFTSTMLAATTVEFIRKDWTPSRNVYLILTVVVMFVVFPLLMASTLLYAKDVRTTSSAYWTILLSILLLVAAGVFAAVDAQSEKRSVAASRRHLYDLLTVMDASGIPYNIIHDTLLHAVCIRDAAQTQFVHVAVREQDASRLQAIGMNPVGKAAVWKLSAGGVDMLAFLVKGAPDNSTYEYADARLQTLYAATAPTHVDLDLGAGMRYPFGSLSLHGPSRPHADIMLHAQFGPRYMDMQRGRRHTTHCVRVNIQ